MAALESRITSDIDLFSVEFRTDPYTYYARLRELGPVVWMERSGIWMVTRHREARAVLGDYTVFSSTGGGGIINFLKEPPWRKPSLLLEADPPEHTRVRAVLARLFTPPALRRMRENFEAVANQLVDQALEAGTFEAISTLVRPFPSTVFPDEVGLAKAGRESLLTYGSMVFGAFGPMTPWLQGLMEKSEAVSAWITAHCQRDALSPGGMGAEIYAAADTGEITEAEAALLVRSLLSAGLDTTIDSLGLAVAALVDNPDQWALLRDDPSLARNAFDEATRYDSGSHSLFRTTLEPTEIAGVAIGKHDKVLVSMAAAGRDPLQWDDPDRFDIRRKTGGHLGYGFGVHACVAQMMAKLEGEVFLNVLAQKVDRLEPAGPRVMRTTPGLRAVDELPLTVSPK